jgi:ribonuclease HI
MINNILLFTDGSVNVETKVGFGACLCINEAELLDENLAVKVKVKRFENTSSTKLELQTLLWALFELKAKEQKVIIYTDSQNIVQLLERRQRLEQNDFYSKNGVLLKNAELYKEFYQIIDSLEYEMIKVQGHQPSRNKNEIERIFALVDKASRKALRNSG